MADFFGSSSGDIITPTGVSALVRGPLFGRPSNADDEIWGFDGDDTIDGGGGADGIYGGAGADSLSGSAGNDWIYGDLGFVGQTAGGNDTIDGGEGDDRLYAIWNSTSIDRGTERNLLSGGLGADTLYGSRGFDTLDGGSGADTYWILSSSTVVREAADSATDTVVTLVDFTLPDRVENLFAAREDPFSRGVIPFSEARSLRLTGNGLDNTIRGYAGNDTLRGLGGFDRLEGAEGDDVLEGGALTDWLFGGAGADLLDGGTDWDVMEGGGGNDLYFVDVTRDSVREVDLTAAGGVDTVVTSVAYSLDIDNGRAGVEQIVATGALDLALTGNARGNSIFGAGGRDTVSGLGGEDRLVGGLGDDTLLGGAGRDTLEGGDGADQLDGEGGGGELRGGRGADVYVVRDTETVTDDAADAGYDQVYAYVSHTLSAGVEMLSLMTAGLTGTGNGGDNFIQTLGGVATLRGSLGNDTLKGAGGNDTLDGGDGDDALEGWAGDNEMRGGAGADVLGGLGGRDTLIGGGGADALIGGLGADSFRFDTAANSLPGAVDRILAGNGAAAFEGAGAAGGDVIDLARIDANTATGGVNDTFRFGGTGAGSLTLASVSGVTFVYGNTDADAAWEFALAIEDGAVSHTAYRAGDFLL